MGEPACLLRSFSHPSDASREVKEGDPIRALTESVSFGRFMSESLAWEKWSAFSHNRYLEEVERFAKPGSVAQKKAYFEAHYRKKAALQESSILVEEPSSGVDVENPTSGLESAEPENHIPCDELQEEHSLDKPANVSVSSTESPMGESMADNVEVTSSGSIEQATAIEDLTQNEDSTEMCNSDECVQIRTSKNKIPNEEATHLETSTSTGGKERATSSSNSLDPSKPSKLLIPRAKGLPTIGNRKKNGSVPNMEKPVIEKRKSAAKSLHMSINFSSSTVSTSKPLSPVLQQIKKLKDITASLKLQRDSLMSRRPLTRASVNVTSKITSAPKPEEQRSKTLLNKSVAGRLMTDKTPNFLTKENSKLSSANGNNVQPPVVFSPFRFRSEERAAKRKQKQEEKINNAKAAENVKPHQRHWIPNSRPQLPKLGKKANSGTVPETKPRPPRQTSVKADAANHTKGKSKPSTRASVPSSAPRKSVRENSSPNIPR